ncbi:MAG: DNA recombination protein RmuC [Deltaproteobacteria bacterium]|nr:DNA recombination protein RmuC [Deltaproteobacteria bacterium]
MMNLATSIAFVAAAGTTLLWIVDRLRLSRELDARKHAEAATERSQQTISDLQRMLASSREQLARATAQNEGERQRHEQSVRERESRLAELREALALRDERVQVQHAELERTHARRAELETALNLERKQAAEKLALVDQAQTSLQHTFEALAARTLQSTQEQARALAEAQLQAFQQGAQGDLERRQLAIDALVKPVSEQLTKLEGHLSGVEKQRLSAQAQLLEQVRQLQSGQGKLESATSHLTQALRAPQTRGRWGEVQLRRVIELAGMVEHCDFEEQQTLASEDGLLRPDVTVKLPAGRRVIVDAKAPLAAYLDAIAATDDATRALHLATHGRHVREHAAKLGKKAYWSQFKGPNGHSPDFVVMFVPNDGAYSAALEQCPDLFDNAFADGVVIATPNNLIALLRTIEIGWRHEALAENADRISALGRDLYKRVADLARHLEAIGDKLGGAVGAYNSAVGSLESRFLPKAREFDRLKIEGPVIEPLTLIEHSPRPLRAPELLLPAVPEDAN